MWFYIILYVILYDYGGYTITFGKVKIDPNHHLEYKVQETNRDKQDSPRFYGHWGEILKCKDKKSMCLDFVKKKIQAVIYKEWISKQAMFFHWIGP